MPSCTETDPVPNLLAVVLALDQEGRRSPCMGLYRRQIAEPWRCGFSVSCAWSTRSATPTEIQDQVGPRLWGSAAGFRLAVASRQGRLGFSWAGPVVKCVKTAGQSWKMQDVRLRCPKATGREISPSDSLQFTAAYRARRWPGDGGMTVTDHLLFEIAAGLRVFYVRYAHMRAHLRAHACAPMGAELDPSRHTPTRNESNSGRAPPIGSHPTMAVLGYIRLLPLLRSGDSRGQARYVGVIVRM